MPRCVALMLCGLLAGVLAACTERAGHGGAGATGGAVAGQMVAGQMAAAAGLDLVDRAAQAGRYQTFLAVVGQAGLESVLRTGGPFTVFMPTDAAFRAMPADQRDWLLAPENRDRLRQLIRFHMIAGAYGSDQLTGRNIKLESVDGRELRLDFTTPAGSVNFAGVMQTDIIAGNGVVHGIDQVLVPF